MKFGWSCELRVELFSVACWEMWTVSSGVYTYCRRTREYSTVYVIKTIGINPIGLGIPKIRSIRVVARLGNEPNLTEQDLSSVRLGIPLTEQEPDSVRASRARLGLESLDPIRQSSRVANILFPRKVN